MLAAAFATWRTASAPAARRDDEPPPCCPPLRPTRDLLAGLLVGLLTGFFGVGGGFLIVPTLAIALTLSMSLAVGTSLIIIALTSLMGLAVHLLAGRGPDIGVTAVLAGACLAGALAGVRLAERVPQRQLGQGFAGLVVAVAGYLLISVAFLGGPPGR